MWLRNLRRSLNRGLYRKMVHSMKAAIESSSTGRVLVFLEIVIALGVAAFVLWHQSASQSSASRATNATLEGGKAFAGYVGPESCRPCHQTQYDLWYHSGHGFAQRPIQPGVDRTAFESARKFEHASQTSQVRIQDGQYQIVTLGFRSNVEPYQIERAIGYEPLRQFLTPAPGGRWQVHEAAYDPKSNQWFNIYGNEDRQPGEYGHWTGRGMNWNSRCASCHNTRLLKNYDEATDSYHTTMAEMGVGCEACHGPLQGHVDWRRAHPNSKALEQGGLIDGAPNSVSAQRDGAASRRNGVRRSVQEPAPPLVKRSQTLDVAAPAIRGAMS